MTAKSFFARTGQHRGHSAFSNVDFLSIGLPLLLSLALGPLVAILIANGYWILALSVLSSVPLAILILRYPFVAIMIWMAVMPWFPFTSTYKYVYFTVHRLLIPLALLLVILYRMLRLRKSRPVQLGTADLAMVGLLALGVVSIFISGNQWKTLFELQDRFLVSFMAYWLVRFSDAHERDLKRLIPLMLLLSLAEYAIGLVSWFSPGLLPQIWNTNLIGDRIVGTFRQPAAYGCVVILFWVLVYHDAMNRKKGLARTFQVLIFILGLACLFFTFTRGVWLAGALVLLALLYLYRRSTASLIAIILPIAVILAAGPLANEFAHAGERLRSTEEGADDRLVQAHAGKEMFYARPVFGWGFNNYDHYDRQFLERVGETTPSKWHIKEGTSHHTYLTILAEMGSVGLLLYALPVVWWLALTIRALPRLPREGFWSQRLLITLWLPIGAHILLAQDIDMRFFPYVLTLFWINLGFVANMVQTSLKSNEIQVAGQVV